MVENRSPPRARANMPICVQNPRGPKSRGPVNACAVASSLSDPSPDHAPARASTAGPVHRWSIIGRVARPHQYACKTRGGRNPKVRQTACPVAPSPSATLPDRAPARARTADPVYRCSKIGPVARPRHWQVACKTRGGPKSRGPVNACPVPPSLSAALPDRAPARERSADNVYRWSKIGRVARPR